MKLLKMTSLILTMILLISSVSFAADNIKVMLDDEYIKFDVEPQIVDGRTMVPLRAIFEAMGAEIYWDEETKSVTAIREETIVIAKIGEKTLHINEDTVKMDVAPLIIEGRTLVPARFISEAFGCDVAWAGEERCVYIRTGFVEYDNNMDVGQD
ncbi:MAG: copper amine oxidase N-terminal domain-containing protein [Clostridia bacterium]|nr:copper amine oxidase N-terminal domain-containing protein [Clostridia bacterium]